MHNRICGGLIIAVPGLGESHPWAVALHVIRCDLETRPFGLAETPGRTNDLVSRLVVLLPEGAEQNEDTTPFVHDDCVQHTVPE
jgi:hypothetical protein